MIALLTRLARIHVDTLNTRSHNSELDAQLSALNAELADKDGLVARYLLEARRRTVDVEKKQHELDLLNKKFDVLMKQRAGVAELDEDAGPCIARRCSNGPCLSLHWVYCPVTPLDGKLYILDF